MTTRHTHACTHTHTHTHKSLVAGACGRIAQGVGVGRDCERLGAPSSAWSEMPFHLPSHPHLQDALFQFTRKSDAGTVKVRQVVPGFHWEVVPSPVVEVRASWTVPSCAEQSCAAAQTHVCICPTCTARAHSQASQFTPPAAHAPLLLRPFVYTAAFTWLCQCACTPSYTHIHHSAHHQADGRLQAQGLSEVGLRFPKPLWYGALACRAIYAALHHMQWVFTDLLCLPQSKTHPHCPAIQTIKPCHHACMQSASITMTMIMHHR
jgi:hypothetical protein